MKINKGLREYINDIDLLRNLVRYQTAPRVSSETVAEHSFFVVAYVLKLNDIYDFDLNKAMMMATLHDYAEAFISDVPHNIKKNFPNLEKEIIKSENEIMEKHINSDFAKWVGEFNNMSSPEGLIVALADTLSVISYAKYEMGLGNSKYMRDVLDDGIRRAYKLYEKCKQYEKSHDENKSVMQEILDFYHA